MTPQTTLRDLRTRLVSLATEGAPYAIVCGRTGLRPVPVSGLRFADRETGATAVRVAEAYRARLRQYDPRLPIHEFVVQETTPTAGRGHPDPVPTVAGSHEPHRADGREPVGIRGVSDER